MATHRKSAGKQRTDHENTNVRFDYSDTYLDNDCLDNQLEDKAFELWREQQRMCVESNESIKKAKKDAHDMQHLKDAVKNRDPNESSNRVVKSADYKKRGPSALVSVSKGTGNASVVIKTSKDTVDGVRADTEDKADNDEESGGRTADVDDEDKQNSESFSSKPLNTLTMFLLSIQNFKRAGNQSLKNDSVKNGKKAGQVLPEVLQTGNESKASDKGRKGEKGTKMTKGSLSRRPSSYHAGQTRVSEHSSNEDQRAQSQYGIHAKKDFTRSRRKLEEISRIEQARYGPVNRYEERRRKLLNACRDTTSLDDRIKHFIKDVEEFNTTLRDENSLEKVLLRTKSARRISRANTFAW